MKNCSCRREGSFRLSERDIEGPLKSFCADEMPSSPLPSIVTLINTKYGV